MVCHLPLLAVLLDTVVPYKFGHYSLNLSNIGTLAQFDERSKTVLPGPYLVITVIWQILEDIEIPYRLVHGRSLEDTGNNIHSQFLAKRVIITEHLPCKTL